MSKYNTEKLLLDSGFPRRKAKEYSGNLDKAIDKQNKEINEKDIQEVDNTYRKRKAKRVSKKEVKE
jgi:hypothetical protein